MSQNESYTSASTVTSPTVVTIYAPTNPFSGTTQSAAPSDTFYDQLQSVVSDVLPRDMLLVLGLFNARVVSYRVVLDLLPNFTSQESDMIYQTF